MSASALKERLRTDLKAAMQARATDEVRTLRTLIAALDNAEAVPSEPGPYAFRALGDPSGEVARLVLDGATVGTVLETEIATRLAAAADYAAHGRAEDAERLHGEVALIRRYLA